MSKFWDFVKKNSLSVIGIFISIIALIISIFSYSQSERSVLIQEKQYFGSISTIWKARVDNDDISIEIISTNPNVHLQLASVIFPSEISEHEWPIESPEFKLHLTSQKVSITDFVSTVIPYKKDFITKLDNEKIPIIIWSRYIVNSELYEDLALYFLDYEGIIWSDEYRTPSVKFNGISFQARLTEVDNKRELLDSMWGRMPSKLVP
jgi:uncharacterized membrane protein YqjE